MISFCLCGQRLVYFAERVVTPGISPHGSSHVFDEKARKRRSAVSFTATFIGCR